MNLAPRNEPEGLSARTQTISLGSGGLHAADVLGGLARWSGALFTIGRRVRSSRQQPFSHRLHHTSRPGIIAEITVGDCQVPLMKWTVAQSITIWTGWCGDLDIVH